MDEQRLQELEFRAELAKMAARDIRELEARPPHEVRSEFYHPASSSHAYNTLLANLIFVLGWEAAKKVKEAELERLLSPPPAQEMQICQPGVTNPPKLCKFVIPDDLPDDLAEAFESMKLAIMRHKHDDWRGIGQSRVLEAIEWLASLATREEEPVS